MTDAIATVAADLGTTESPVILVDHYTGFDIGSMLQRDNIHHNRIGEAWVAENGFEVLASIWPASGQRWLTAQGSFEGSIAKILCSRLWIQPVHAMHINAGLLRLGDDQT